MDTQNQSEPSPIAPKALVDSVEDKKPSPVPQGSRTQSKKGKKTSSYLSNFVEERTYLLVHLFGYSLLAFSLIDYLHIIIPPRFTDPVWEFQTLGALVEHSAVLLLGLILVFYRREGYIGYWEKKLLGCLSWVSLLLGLLYLLMLPLGVADTWRIHQRNKAEISAQVSQQTQQFQQVKEQMSQAKTDVQIEQLLAALTPQGRAPQIKNSQEFKDRFLAQVNQAEQSMKLQAQARQKNQQTALLKNSVKWNLGALISATLLISIWHFTYWARRSQ